MAKHRFLANTQLGVVLDDVDALVAAEPPLLREAAECTHKVLIHQARRPACMAWLHGDGVPGYYDELRKSTFINELSFS
ncbi:MAG: hypothetical protein EOP83_35450, partial [Verrucomicrobiaceae bacterium]